MPKQPFLDWLLTTDEEPGALLSLAALRDDPEVFLVSEGAGERDLKLFKAWVEVLCDSFVWDLAGDLPMEIKNWDEPGGPSRLRSPCRNS